MRVHWEDSNYSRIQLVTGIEGVFSYILYKHDFFIIDYPSPSFLQDDESLIISQSTEWVKGPWEGNQPLLTASAIVIDTDGVSRTLWNFTDEVDAGGQKGYFYQTEQYGCCDARIVYRLHRLKDGKFLMSYNNDLNDLLSFDTSTSGRWSRATARYIGGLDASYIDELSVLNDSSVIGVINYVSEDSCRHMLLVRAVNKEMREKFYECYTFAELSLSETDSILHVPNLSFTANRSDITPFSKVTLIAKMSCDTTIFAIPIQNDDFILTAQPSKDYEIVRIR